MFVGLSLFVQPVSVFAQEYSSDDSEPRYTAEDPDNSSQIDITHGMAEQNGLYAIRQGRPLQGQAQVQNQQSFMQNNSGMYGEPQIGMQSNNMGCNGFNQMNQIDPNNQMNQNHNCMNSGMGNPPANQGLSGLLGGAITPGLTKQVAGAVGAALMFNYMTQGGAQSLVNSMSAKGWRGGRRTLGSGGVVYTH